MRHRRARADCPLCPLWGVAWDADDATTHNQQHAHAERLWRAWNGGRGRDWELSVCEAAASLGVACSPEQAKAHFHFHRVEQPALSGSLQRERLLYEANRLSPRAQAIITAVYRHRLLSTEQLREVFFAGNGRTDATARWMANTELTALCARHFLYRLYPDARMASKRDAPQNFAKQALWLLGKASVPFVERSQNVTVWRDHYVQMAKEVSDVKIIHDLRANEIYVRLVRSLRHREGMVAFSGHGQAAVELLSENWYGDKALMLAFYDTARRHEDEIRADGFATLSVQRNQWGGKDPGLPSCQLPFFYEYDRGSKSTRDVAHQLLSYHLLARSRKASERFPDLDIEGYAVPALMVFSDRSRLRNTHREFLRLAAAEKLPRGVPLLLVAEEDWRRDPLDPDICYLAWEERTQTFSFLDLLARASASLISAHSVLASQTLAIDLKAARRTTGAVTADSLEQQRSKLAGQRTDAAVEQRLERERERRTELLSSLRAKKTAADANAGTPPKPH